LPSTIREHQDKTSNDEIEISHFPALTLPIFLAAGGSDKPKAKTYTPADVELTMPMVQADKQETLQ
jgi:hypothetical protein